jgi:hypothetical protein
MPLTTTGDRTTHTARLAPARPHAGHLGQLPDRLLNLNCAVTMTPAGAAASGARPRHRIWLHIGNHAVELSRTAPQAITIATRPPETASGREPARSPVGRQMVGP